MAAESEPVMDITGLLTAGKIAERLGVSDNKAKKAIKELALEPVAKKGVCNYYSDEQCEAVRLALA